jgi:hypothetical protein
MALEDAEREELETLRAERAIHRVMLAYARGVDTCDFERVRDCFHADARVEWGDWYRGSRDEAIRWLSETIPSLDGTLHVFGSPWIEVDLPSGTARCETYSINSARYPRDEAGGVVQNVAGTRYYDDFELRDGHWRIVRRRNERVWVQNTRDHVEEPPVRARREH